MAFTDQPNSKCQVADFAMTHCPRGLYYLCSWELTRQVRVHCCASELQKALIFPALFISATIDYVQTEPGHDAAEQFSPRF